MNEGQYLAIRNYLEEIASNQKQILAELKRQAADKARDEIIVGIAEREGVKPSDVAVAMGGDNIVATAVRGKEPWKGYDGMNVEQVLAEAKTRTNDTRAYALAYERQNKKRAGVITPLVNWNS